MTVSAADAVAPSDRLYDLLPAVYRMRDAAEGLPLRDLLRVIAEQVDVVERDIAALYENWFVETAADWAVPYLAEVIGYTPLSTTTPAGDGETARDLARTAMLVPRRDVAHTLRNRGRKGTLAILEELAADVAGWPSAAVEFYRLLAWTQSLNHQRPTRGRFVDLRDVEALDRLEGAFDELAHTVDVRRISSHRTPGRYNIPEVGLFVWRLRSYPVTGTTANRAEQAGRHCFTFSVLGNDAPLFTNPDPEPSIGHLARETNVPAPIRRLAFQDPRRPVRGQDVRASAAYYGDGRSVSIRAEGWPTKASPQPVPASLIVPADLSGWRYRVPTGLVAVDPVLGRIMFPTRRPPTDVEVTYHYGFSADLGGGEYDRPIPTRSLRALSEFAPADMLDAPAILTRLATAGGTLEQDLVARWSDTDRALLDQWKAAEPPVAVSTDLASALLAELNLLLADDTLYSQDRFPTAPPELVAAALDSPAGGRLAREPSAPGSRLRRRHRYRAVGGSRERRDRVARPARRMARRRTEARRDPARPQRGVWSVDRRGARPRPGAHSPRRQPHPPGDLARRPRSRAAGLIERDDARRKSAWCSTASSSRAGRCTSRPTTRTPTPPTTPTRPSTPMRPATPALRTRPRPGSQAAHRHRASGSDA